MKKLLDAIVLAALTSSAAFGQAYLSPKNVPTNRDMAA